MHKTQITSYCSFRPLCVHMALWTHSRFSFWLCLLMDRTRQFQLLQPSLAPHRSLRGGLIHFCRNSFFPQVLVCLDYTSNPSPMSVWRIQVPANVLFLSHSLFLSDGFKQTLLFFLLYYNSIFHNVRVTTVAFKWLMSLHIHAPWALKQYSASEGVWGREGLREYGREWERHFALIASPRRNWRIL